MPVLARIARAAANATSFSVASFDLTKNDFRDGTFGPVEHIGKINRQPVV